MVFKILIKSTIIRIPVFFTERGREGIEEYPSGEAKKKGFKEDFQGFVMASRLMNQQENRGKAVLGGIKQKNVAAERKNRPALIDIGNQVTIPGVEGKLVPKVSTPNHALSSTDSTMDIPRKESARGHQEFPPAKLFFSTWFPLYALSFLCFCHVEVKQVNKHNYRGKII
ncbi:uncharacterized protein LOC111391165 [Olea europaea var. sylvestris]|uniref:uncharacterized protein LOC111391165 n=1 Tax=Olea europaea var. sylvestris TaxID=158386 RepID=UPI000C1D0D78|nr:uncharacterized protein LOC111391165 [Olea europaea var. sylvestris]